MLATKRVLWINRQNKGFDTGLPLKLSCSHIVGCQRVILDTKSKIRSESDVEEIEYLKYILSETKEIKQLYINELNN